MCWCVIIWQLLSSHVSFHEVLQIDKFIFVEKGMLRKINVFDDFPNNQIRLGDWDGFNAKKSFTVVSK